MRLKLLFIYVTVAAFLAAGTIVRAQSFEPFSPYGIFSPSVESYQMTRCGNLLPSLYTGAMTFSLPLMTYSDPDFTIPVTLEYSFDGYKPGQHSGSVGYGWYLNCGGVITREVRGIPDEGDLDGGTSYSCPVYGWRQAGSYRDSLETHFDSICSIRRKPTDHSSVEEYTGILQGYDPFSDKPVYASPTGSGFHLYDTAPDIYHFRFLGHSGDFMMLPDGTVRVYNSDIPHGEVSVQFTDYGNDPSYVIITLTTGDGYVYRFETEGVSETPNPGGDHPLRPSKSVSAYRLTGIEAPNHRKVTFTYDTYYTPLLSFQYGSFLEGGYLIQGIWDTDSQQGSIFPEFDVRRTYVREAAACLKKVAVFDADTPSPADSILFTYADAPGDEGASSCFESGTLPSGFVPEDTAPVLVSVALYGNDGPADSATLTYISAPGGTPKTFLHSVSGMKTGTHTFDYALDGFTLPKNDTQGTDHWGYWNGASISDLRQHLTETSWMFDTDPDPDPDFVQPCADHLYDQMTDGVKEAAPAYSVCGALTAIRYPHGGKTVVEYEPNRVTRRMNVRSTQVERFLEPVDSLNAAATWTVGGVRVKTLVDSTGTGQRDTTRFAYTDPAAGGRGSGILMAMPKYAEAAQYTVRVYSIYTFQGISGVADVNAIGFNNCCGFTLVRDPHVVYPTVTAVHPDGSSTEHRFTSVDNAGLGDGYSGGWTLAKHILGASDWLEPDTRTPTCMIPASLDCKNLRGQPLRTVVRDSAGRELKRTEYVYAYDQVTIPRLGFNNILTYNLAPYTVRSPRLVSTTETDHGLTTRTDRTYNALGQLKTTSITGGVAGCDTLRTTLRYRHETGDTSPRRVLLDAAAKTRVCDGGGEYLLAREQYAYKSGTRKLSGITSFMPDPPVFVDASATPFSLEAEAGTERVSSFDYDDLEHLSEACFPGCDSIFYTWNGSHLVSKTENELTNTTLFHWKDLVGLTQVESPTGRTESYLYDDRNRPWKTLDSDSLTVSVFHYHLKNE